MRLHVPSLPWTETNTDYLSCAYTQKVVKFCQMMKSLGHEVILYAAENNRAPCSEHHVVVTAKEQQKWFGKFNPLEASIQEKITWDPKSEPWTTMNGRIIELMRKTEEKDIFCPIMGWCHYPIAESRPEMSVAEWGIGYEGVVPRERWHWCFESHAWRHYVYGQQKIVDGRNYDTVIPNSFDPADFKFSGEKGSYLLFLGRIVERKGPHIGAIIAERLGMRYKVAGPGAKQVGENVVAPEISFKGEYVGPVGLTDRAYLLKHAAAIIVPTKYIEPFGGVAVEAMMCGTPAVAHNFGAFQETVQEGMSGARFSTIPEGCAAVQRAMALDRRRIAAYAEKFSIWSIRHRYDAWLANIHGLWADNTGVGDYFGAGALVLTSPQSGDVDLSRAHHLSGLGSGSEVLSRCRRSADH